MGAPKYIIAGAVFAVAAQAAPQAPYFPAITAAPSVPNGPDNNGDNFQTASLVTTFAPPQPSAAPSSPSRRDLSNLSKRTWWVTYNKGCKCPWYDFLCWWTKPVCPPTQPSGPKTTCLTTTTTAPSTSSTLPPTTTAKPTCPGDNYTPYYAALATGYTTDPALAYSRTVSATGPCPTTPEAGTYCGFINPQDPCAPQPDGYGPISSPDTVDAFLNNQVLQSQALTAPTSVPAADGKQYSQTFVNLKGSTSAQSYLGLRGLKDYDVKTCAAYCDCTDLCTSFNIYIERDPSLNPTNNNSNYDPGYETVWGQDCPNPASMTTYKCTLWGSAIDASTATNTGQGREQFQVAITGSNGYTKTNVTTPVQPVPNPPKPPKNCGGKGIDAPKWCIGKNFFPGPYNPKVCYTYALALNAQNQLANIKQSCKFFNAYYLLKNGKPHGTYCNLYNTEIDISFATYVGGKIGGDQFSLETSWGFSM